MRSPDHDRERSEAPRTLRAFLEEYNRDLPDAFPHATPELLQEFKKGHPVFFKDKAAWSLGLHRKRVMDWLQMRTTLHSSSA